MYDGAGDMSVNNSVNNLINGMDVSTKGSHLFTLFDGVISKVNKISEYVQKKKKKNIN